MVPFFAVIWYCAPAPTTGLNSPSSRGACRPMPPLMPWAHPTVAKPNAKAITTVPILTRLMTCLLSN